LVFLDGQADKSTEEETSEINSTKKEKLNVEDGSRVTLTNVHHANHSIKFCPKRKVLSQINIDVFMEVQELN